MKESNEELDKIAAEEVFGWTLEPLYAAPGEWCDPDGMIMHRENDWHPCTDRNQSRLVVEAAVKSISVPWHIDSCLHELVGVGDFPPKSWRLATPRQEVEAAIMAVRALAVFEGKS